VGDIYLPIVDILTAAGVPTGVGSINEGWEYRARSTGGFSSLPKGVWWHHTASDTGIQNDLSWQIDGCDDAPVGNCTIDRDGVVWPVAGGASNCAGKGGPAYFSRGSVAVDSGNTGGFNIEVANNGVGQRWPQAQVDSFFATSNAINAYCGNIAEDLITHHVWAPDRKIDPARGGSVEGPWQPREINSSGTWELVDIQAECARRALGTEPEPEPEPPEEDEVKFLLIQSQDGSLYAAPPDLTSRFSLWGEDYAALLATGEYVEVIGMRQDSIARIPGVGADIITDVRGDNQGNV